MTKKLIYLEGVASSLSSIKIMGYEFHRDKKLNPIPVEVSSEEAKILLQMTQRVRSCCGNERKPLFQEVE